jgi:hypothetical protein
MAVVINNIVRDNCPIVFRLWNCILSIIHSLLIMMSINELFIIDNIVTQYVENTVEIYNRLGCIV